jgi:hypothetical protein
MRFSLKISFSSKKIQNLIYEANGVFSKKMDYQIKYFILKKIVYLIFKVGFQRFFETLKLKLTN